MRYPRFGHAIFALMVVTSSLHAQPQYYVEQPANKRSTLFGIGWEAITDAEFADMAKGLLMKNGNTNAAGATFLFEQCFSGGMFDDLDDAFGNEVRWVGGSAARHDEVSYGQGNSKPFPLDFWVMGLRDALELPFPQPSLIPMINYVNLARQLDPAGPSGSNKETPQSIYRNGGETIRHQASLPAVNGGHNAILWAGNADGKRHVNDIKVMYELLKEDFQATGDPWSIIVLGDENDLGIPSLPATKANLQVAFDALEAIQSPDDNFYFFASNHGGVDTIVEPQPQTLGVGASLIRRFDLSQVELDGIFATPEGIPGIVLDFDRLVGRGLRVFIDGVELDDPFVKFDALGDPFLCIDRDVLRRLGPEFELRLINETGDRVILNEIAFRTGGITNAIPEANSLILVGMGITVGALRLSRKRTTPGSLFPSTEA